MNVKPTRSELMKVKRQIKMAVSGHKLLKKKRDGLILEFFEILKEAKSVRKELVDAYKDALMKINITRAQETDAVVRSISFTASHQPTVEMSSKNIMGVLVPIISGEQVEKKFYQRGYGFLTATVMIDEAAKAYEIVVQKIIRAAESETTMKKLLREIEKTKRRVNALEFEVIPRFKKVQSYIRFRLEEMERENTFRMKRIKKKAGEN